MAMNSDPNRRKGLDAGSIAVICIGAVVTIALILALIFVLKPVEKPKPTEPPTEATEPATEATEPALREMLPHMAELYAQNPDIVGWMTMEDTVLDYPVMQTPDDPEKYLHLDFDGTYDFAGELFIDARCTLDFDFVDETDTESDNLIVYGHNMKNGTMFRPILNYKKEAYWKEHPTFTFTTLYEERTYEVVAAFYDRVYYKYEDVFKFYQFIDAEEEADFDEAVNYYHEKARYDTGVTPEYGDKLITLVTCSSYVDNGRFVVIGRMVTEEE